MATVTQTLSSTDLQTMRTQGNMMTHVGHSKDNTTGARYDIWYSTTDTKFYLVVTPTL